MHSDEREMLRGSLRRVLTETDPVKLPAALDEFGWPDLLASDPAEAVPALFETQGETVTASPALNAVMAGPLLAAGRLDAGGARAGVGEWTVVLPGPGSGSGRAGPVLAVAAGAAVTRCLLVGQHDGHTTLAVVDTADGGRGGGPVEFVDGVDPWLGLVRIVDRRSPPVRVAARGDAVSTAWAESVAAGRRALAHELCGLGRAMLALAVDHARERRQFGRPIGTFQAVKHRCADMLVDVEGMRSTVYWAAWCIGANDPDASVAASTAKVWCADASKRVMASALQVHGGIGFTWEHDLHFFMKRAQLDQLAFGDASFHRARLTELLRPRVEAGDSVV